MFSFKLFHSVDEHIDALHGQSVVQRSAESAYRAVSLDAYDATSRREVNKVLLKLFVFGSHHEAYVHNRTVSLIGNCTCEHLAGIDCLVKCLGFLYVYLFDSLYAAEFFVITEGLEAE